MVITCSYAFVRGIGPCFPRANRIAEALAAGDGETAAAAMRDHLGEAKRCFIAATGLDKES